MAEISLQCTCGPERFERSDARHKPGCPIGDWLAGRPAKEELSPIAQFGAEQLAKLFHETYERLAPHFGYKTRFVNYPNWDDIPKSSPNRTLMLATCEEVLRKLEQAAGNEPLTMLVSKNEDRIRIDFTKRIGMMQLEKNHAINFAITILQHCGVPVNVLINPPPPPSPENPV